MSNGDLSHFEDMAALHALGLLDDAGERGTFPGRERRSRCRRALARHRRDGRATRLRSARGCPPPELKKEHPRAAARAREIENPHVPFLRDSLCHRRRPMRRDARRATGPGHQVDRSAPHRAERRLAARRQRRAQESEAGHARGQGPGLRGVESHVAWDPNRNRGLFAMQSLPAAPAGHDYQLWLLDPAAPAPVSAGVVTASRSFDVAKVSTPTPGFAVSLEPGGGSPAPTGPILFAVAPGP